MVEGAVKADTKKREILTYPEATKHLRTMYIANAVTADNKTADNK
jgi:hypothetical protein